MFPGCSSAVESFWQVTAADFDARVRLARPFIIEDAGEGREGVQGNMLGFTSMGLITRTCHARSKITN